MDVEFADDDVDRLETDLAFDGGLPVGVVKAYRMRLQQLRAARDERDFYALKSLHFEKLKGDRKHQHSMRLNKQFRLVLEFVGDGKNKKLLIISVEDYH